MIIGRPKFVLASGSPRRLTLINQIGIEPDALRPADIDEMPLRGELPRACANRLARGKAEAALAAVKLDDELAGSYILAADTVVAVGRRILPKADLLDEAAQCLRLLSGRNHRVHTGVCLVTPKEAFRQRLIETRVRFKRLSEQDIEAYLASGEWRGKAGGYAAQGLAGSFIVKIVGSYTNIVGLPLYETATLLVRRGLPDPLRLAQRGLAAIARPHESRALARTRGQGRSTAPRARRRLARAADLRRDGRPRGAARRRACAALGLKPGDRVAIVAKNSPDYVETALRDLARRAWPRCRPTPSCTAPSSATSSSNPARGCASPPTGSTARSRRMRRKASSG